MPGPTPAQAQTQNIRVSPDKRDFTNLNANPDPTFEFTVGEDATITSLDFSVSGNDWVQGYTLTINGKSL
ncbi:hypothetical protein CJ199_14920, partial [Brevibacterium paucivorans]